MSRPVVTRPEAKGQRCTGPRATGPRATFRAATGRAATSRAAGVALALVADRVLGEPPAAVHPVARFGQAMEKVERRLWADRRGHGALYAATGVGAAAAVGALLPRRSGTGRIAALAVATYVAVASRALCDAATEVGRALDRGDLDGARALVRSLVGRETADLDGAEIVRAVVESVAENTVDAVTAPLLWAATAGAPGVLAYRALNTLDAMVGHRSPRYQRFGWASARGDDAANWVPARLTAAAVAAVRPDAGVAVWRAVRDQAPAHPSPNAGVVEGAFAAALGVTLGGVNDYAGRVEVRPTLGWGDPPQPRHIEEACRLTRRVSAAMCAAMIFVTAVRAR